MLVSCLGRGRLEGECRGQLSWEPPARQLGAGQSWREEFRAGEMSLCEAGEAVGAVLLHKSTGAGLWRGLRPFLLLHLPQAACALQGSWLSPCPFKCPFQSLAFTCHCQPETGAVLIISSPLILPSLLQAALGLPPSCISYSIASCLGWREEGSLTSPLLPSLLCLKMCLLLPGLSDHLSSLARCVAVNSKGPYR